MVIPTNYEFYQFRLNLQISSGEVIPSEYSWMQYAVARCQRPARKGVGMKDIELCESGPREALTQYFPVVVGDDLYKNIHCASCNLGPGYFDFQAITMTIYCENTQPSLVTDGVEEHNLLEALNSGICFSRYIEPEHVSSLKPFLGYESRGDCDDAYNTTLDNFQELAEACHSYTAFVQSKNINHHGHVFDNIHCAVCSGVPVADLECASSVPTKIALGSTKIQQFPKFVLRMNSSRNVDVQLATARPCDNQTEVLRLADNTCLQIPCLSGYFHLGGYCLSRKNIHFQEMRLQNDSLLRLCFALPRSASCDQGNCTTSETMALTFNTFLWNAFRIPPSVHPVINSSCLAGSMEANMDEVYFLELALILSDYLTNPLRHFFFTDLFTEILNKLEKDIPIINVTVIQADESSASTQTSAEEVIVEDVILVADEPLHDEPMSHIMTILHIMKIYLPLYGIPIGSEYASVKITASRSNNSLGWSFVRSVAVHVLIIAPCFDDGFFNSSCLNSSSRWNLDMYGVDQKPLSEILKIFSSVSIAGSALSIVGIVASLIIHHTIPSMDNIPGKALVNLLMSVLLGQVFFLVSGIFNGHSLICFVVAAVQHYTWLASFFWMNILSYNIFKTFTVLTKGQTLNQAKYLRLYLLYAWGGPAVIVFSCCLLHNFGFFQYGSQNYCWIVGSINLGLSFGLPVATLIFCNIFLFIVTARSIKSMMDRASLVSDSYTTRQRLILYIKLSSTMGLTWLFGFIGNIPRLDFFRYAFVVLSSLNGFFLALCFTLSTRVCASLKTKIRSHNSLSRKTTVMEKCEVDKTLQSSIKKTEKAVLAQETTT